MVEILGMVQEKVALITIFTNLETSIMFLVAAMENHSAKYVVNMVTLRLIAIIDLINLSTNNEQSACCNGCNSVHCWRWKLVHGYRSYASPNSKSQQFEFTYSICWFRLSRRWKWYLFKYLKYRTLHYFFSFSVIKSKEYFTCSTTYNQSDKCE